MSAGITDLRYVWRNGERVMQYNDQQGHWLDWHDVPTAECPHERGINRSSRRCIDCGRTMPHWWKLKTPRAFQDKP